MNNWLPHVSILKCPHTDEALRPLEASKLASLNARIAAGEKVHADGSPVAAPLHDGALSNAGGTHVYRVEDDIAWLLPVLAVVGVEHVGATGVIGESEVVRRFYEEFGWMKNGDGTYNDNVVFTATTHVASAYSARCNDRVLAQLGSGKYLLDAASGPVPGASYAMLSQHYEKRICVDFSHRALLEAKANIGAHGLFLLGDLTRLPIADGQVDDAISLHTIYHVPDDQQSVAVDELVRAVRPGGKAVIVYEWRSSPIMAGILSVTMAVGRIRGLLARRGATAPQGQGQAPPAQPGLYFSPKPRAWFAQLRARHDAKLRLWSMVSSTFNRAFFRDTAFGRLAAATVYPLETAIEPIAARYGVYPMFVIEAPAR